MQKADTSFQLSDVPGLFLRVMPNGKKIWIINKSIKGKRISKQIGVYPEMTIKDARACLERYIADNSNRAIKLKTFSAVYNEWLDIKKTQIKNWCDIQQRFEKYILPVFAEHTYESIEPYEIIGSLKNSLLSQGKLETIKRICGPLKEIEIYALNCEYIKSLKLQGMMSVIMVAFYALLRPNEYCSLEWDWIDEDMTTITVPSVSMT